VLLQLGLVLAAGLLAVASWRSRLPHPARSLPVGSYGVPWPTSSVGSAALPADPGADLHLPAGDFVLNIMNPFYLDLGFTKTEIAEVRKVFGVVATTLGVFFGGWSVARLGILRTLMIGAFMGPLSNLAFAWLATQGSSVPALFVAIGVDNVAGGYAGTALIAYMSSLTSLGFTATQYALFSSLYALPGKLVASQSGRIVEASARSADAGASQRPC
jgi:hypothetical protein